ncbi:copia protein [Tanacetum coccineum]
MLQEVWTLVELPNGKRAITTKWVFSNKKDERGIVIKNKERLVSQGYIQEEGINYDEVFSPVARIEAIRLFLAYASFKDFVVYQMDVKSAFLYGKIEEEVYVCQPPGFEDPYFPDKVYKVEKALYGLHQAPRAWSTRKKMCLQVKQKEDGIFISQDKYVNEILNKFGFSDIKTARKPMETQKALLKDADGKDDSPFDLVAYTDSEYAGASLDRKSITGGCQFLGCMLISWQCKKQTVVANSIIKAEYIAASNCCGQANRMQPKMKLVAVLVEQNTLLEDALTRWFEKMEFVFRIKDCATGSQVKFATYTLLDGALTWWNSYVQTVGIDEAYEISWKDLMKLMIKVYCPRNEIQKLESELWNLSVKGTDVAGYTRRFQELSLLCPRMVLKEEDKIERYIRGLPDNIQGNMTSSKPTRLQDAIKMANNLMHQKVRAIGTRDANNKRKWEDEQEGIHRQQQNKRQEVGRVYVVGTGNNTSYAKTLPLCDKCKLHHHGPCPVKCGNCKKVGHQARDYWTPTSVTCYGCRGKGHTKRYCPGLENQNGDEEARQNPDIVTGTFLPKNYYIPVLTNASVNRSFVFIAISHLNDVDSTFSVA